MKGLDTPGGEIERRQQGGIDISGQRLRIERFAQLRIASVEALRVLHHRRIATLAHILDDAGHDLSHIGLRLALIVDERGEGGGEIGVGIGEVLGHGLFTRIITHAAEAIIYVDVTKLYC